MDRDRKQLPVILTTILIVLLGVGMKVWSQQATTQPSGTAVISSPDKESSGKPVPARIEGADKQEPTTPTTKSTSGKQDGNNAPVNPMFGRWFLPLMIGLLILMWIWMGRSRRKEQQRRKQMLESLKKGDKVTTIGGIIGTIVEIRDDEIILKVDESANVRMKFARWAIRGVGPESKSENPQEDSNKS